MKAPQKSIFNLIEIFSTKRSPVVEMVNAKEHCEQRNIHDFYCEAEQPFIATF